MIGLLLSSRLQKREPLGKIQTKMLSVRQVLEIAEIRYIWTQQKTVQNCAQTVSGYTTAGSTVLLPQVYTARR